MQRSMVSQLPDCRLMGSDRYCSRITSKPEIEVQPSPTVPLRPHNSACNVESRLSHIIMMTLHTVQYQNHPDHRLAAPSLRPPCRDKALTTSNVANVQQSG